jgi:O-antigen ligase
LISAMVSAFQEVAFSKALRLLLLFLYGASGARLAVIGREDRFFHGLTLGSEIAVYAVAVSYLGLHLRIFGNPNSLGVVTGIGLFPVLLWAVLTSETRPARYRRTLALLLCGYLLYSSMARAGMIAALVSTFILCLSLRQYKLLLQGAGLILFLVAVTGTVAPIYFEESISQFSDAIFYKGHKEEGILGSRQPPWQRAVSEMQQHPFFGSGFGTSPSGEDPGLKFGKFASSKETNREHGSSYLAVAEWQGLLGLMPFISILVLVVWQIWKVCSWMHRTSNPHHYSVPLAMVLVAGLVHAFFEDWLFAVGYYMCVYFWTFAFVLADLVPASTPALVETTASHRHPVISITGSYAATR